MSPVYEWIEIDVSKDQLDVYSLSTKELSQFGNHREGIKQLKQHLHRQQRPAVVREASGGYESAMALALSESGIAVSVVNPRAVRNFAKALGHPAKTDALDAQVAAQFGRALTPATTVFASQAQQQLKDWGSRRAQLVERLMPILSGCKSASAKSMRKSNASVTQPWNGNPAKLCCNRSKALGL